MKTPSGQEKHDGRDGIEDAVLEPKKPKKKTGEGDRTA
jgi:hypothetical protein